MGAPYANREAYAAWEARVISEFHQRSDYAGKREAVRRKVVVVAVPPRHDGRGAQLGYIRMWHIGKGETDAVKAGRDAVSKTTFYPATDTGGLTNVRSEMNAPRPRFVGKTFGPAPVSVRDVAEAYTEWLRLSGKTGFRAANGSGPVRVGFRKWIQSVPDGWSIKFHRLPDETRTLVPREEVFSRTGEYYERVFGKGDQQYAKISLPGDGRKLWAAVTPGFVTPNINVANVYNEYALRPPPRPRPTKRPSKRANIF